MVLIDGFFYEKSSRKDKKLQTKFRGKTIHFGDSKMQQYKDRSGYWKKLDHGDKKRRDNYLSRAKGIKNKKGELTWKDPTSPNYHSIKILWP
jgi:hypothetical protein